MTSESEKTRKRERFLAWASEVGDPGGNALAGGPPVTRVALETARRELSAEHPTEREVFRLAARLDAERVVPAEKERVWSTAREFLRRAHGPVHSVQTPSEFDLNDVRRALNALAHAFDSTHPDSVRMENVVGEFDEFTSPLSWRKKGWVHTLPLAITNSAEAHHAVREIAATFTLAVPADHLLVVAYPALDNRLLEEELTAGIQKLGSRVRAVSLAWSANGLDTTALRDLITADIQSAA